MSALDIVWGVVRKMQPASEAAWHLLWPTTIGVYEDAKRRESEGASEEEIAAAAQQKLEQDLDNPLIQANLYGSSPQEAVLTPEEIAAGMTAEEKQIQLLMNEGYEMGPGATAPGLYGNVHAVNDPGMLAAGRLAMQDSDIEMRDWAAVSTGNMPMIRGMAPPRDTIGFQDVPYTEYYQGSMPQLEPVITGRALGWEIDEARIEDGQSFVRKVEKDIPFTVRDAMTLYDAQDPQTQRLIAQSLAIGTGDKSYMADALGTAMFRDPSLIYERESVLGGLLELAADAAYTANLSGGGMDAYQMIKLELPKLRKQDFTIADMEGLSASGLLTESGLTMDQLSDELFDLATNTGVVKRIAQTHSRALASEIYRRVVGRQPDEAAFALFDQWALEAEQSNMGMSAQPTDTEMKSYFGEQIVEETEEGGAFEEDSRLATAESAIDAILNFFGSKR